MTISQGFKSQYFRTNKSLKITVCCIEFLRMLRLVVDLSSFPPMNDIGRNCEQGACPWFTGPDLKAIASLLILQDNTSTSEP